MKMYILLQSGRRAFVFILALLVLFLFLFLAQSTQAQTSHAIYTIRDDATGGDCQVIGSWDQATKTCALTQDIDIPYSSEADVAIEIASDGIVLDGNRHKLTDHGLGDFYSGYPAGVSITGKAGVAVRNLSIFGFSSGIIAASSSGIEIFNNRFENPSWSCLEVHDPGHDNIIMGNIFNGCFVTIDLSGDSNMVAGNSFFHSAENVTFYGDQNTFDQNYIDVSTEGIQGSGDSNVITRNLFESGSHIHLGLAYDTMISGNTLNGGIYHMPPPPGPTPPFYWDYASKVYGNNFIDSMVWADDFFAPSFQTSIFNQSAPTGGNYWSFFDDVAEGCSDLDSNGFCDAPYNFGYGNDNLPLTSPVGCERPDIGIIMTGIYWRSYSDYLARHLTVDFTLANNGSSGAYDITIVGSRSDGDVHPAPVAGYFLQRQTLVSGGSTEMTLKYQVPEGTVKFRTTTYATAKSICGDVYEFPSPMPAGADAVQF